MASLTLLSWNVNGLRAAERKGFLVWVKKAQPDILCLNETKSRPEQLSGELINIPGYESHFSSAEKKGYSGVAIYTKIKPLSIKTTFNKKFDSEGRFMQAEYQKFTLLNIYFPNGGASAMRLNYKLDFYKTFLSYIEKLRAAGQSIIFCGDMNTAHRAIDLARPEANSKTSGFLPEERAWIDKLIDQGYLDTFRVFHPDQKDAYSWWDLKTRARERNVGWRIDYFFISKDLKPRLQDAFILPDVPGSDHCPVGIKLAV